MIWYASQYVVIIHTSRLRCKQIHYNDVMMSAMASQITILTIVYSRRRSKVTSRLLVTGFCEGNSPMTGEFPAQRASNAEKVSIWWRYRARAVVHPKQHSKKDTVIIQTYAPGKMTYTREYMWLYHWQQRIVMIPNMAVLDGNVGCHNDDLPCHQ